MPYQSIFSGGGGNLPAGAQAITDQFQPGQYAKINAQIAAKSSSPAGDLPTLRTQLRNGSINQDQFIQQFNKITGNGPAPAPYSPQNLAWALGNTAKLAGGVAAGAVQGAAEQTGHALNELSATPLNPGPKTPDTIDQTTQQIHQQLLKSGMNPALVQKITDQVRAKGYQKFLNDAGIGINDSPVTVGRKAVGNIGGTIANFFPVGKALESTALLGRILKTAVYGGVAGGVGNLANENLTPQNEATSIVGGAGTAALLPPLAEGGKSLLGRALNKVLQSRAAGEIRPPSALDNLAEGVEQAQKSASTAETPKTAPAAPTKPTGPKMAAIKDLTSYEGAPDKAQVAKYKADIQAGKPIEPLLVKKDSLGNLGVEDGKHRLEAAKQAGLTEVPVKDVTEKTSGSALKTEQRAVEAKLAKEFEGKASYTPGSYKTEAANAVKLVKENPEEARSIALGEKPGNNTIHEVAVRRAVENDALKNGDVETLRQIANSSSHTQTSEAAQRLGSEAFNSDGTSPVDAMREVINARKAAAAKKLGTNADEAVSSEVKAIRSAAPKVTHQTWNDFVESIKC